MRPPPKDELHLGMIVYLVCVIIVFSLLWAVL